MPRLWRDTIEAHRTEVRGAILDAAAAAVLEQGLLSVTMSEIAHRAGIGRATLYKYFPDVEAVLLAWHDRHVARHLVHLAHVAGRAGDADERLAAVLEAYALILFESHRYDADLVAFVHRDAKLAHPERQVRDLVRELVREAVRAGDVRDDVPPNELAAYCLRALSAAASLPSKPAVLRLVTVTLAGLRRPGS